MAFRDIEDSKNIKTIGTHKFTPKRKVPYYHRVDIRKEMESYHKASENNWDVQPSTVRSVGRMLYNRLKSVPQFKTRTELSRIKRAGNWVEMEAAMDALWLYAEERRVLLIA